MNPLFQTLATLYRKSALRKRDFIIEYEKFLRTAGAADGDARELAEKELRLAESESEEILRIERQPKSGLPLNIRLSANGGEDWLFSKIGEPTPTQEREELAGFFEQASNRKIPDDWADKWKTWCGSLATRAREGSSVQPFSKTGNEDLMTALAGVLNWQGESLIRYASAQICGDSKRLQALETRLLAALDEITGEASLEAFGIFHKPRAVMLHGPLELRFPDGTSDLSNQPGPVTLSETNLVEALGISTSAKLCLTVENEDVFMELAKRNPGILLIQTSYPGSAVRRLIGALSEMNFLHFGDSDPAGFDILRDLRERTGRDFRPMLMVHRPSPQPVALSSRDSKMLDRLAASPLMADVREELRKISDSGDKGLFEQEVLEVETVLESIVSEVQRIKTPC